MSKGVPPKAIPQVQGKYKRRVPMGFSYLPKKTIMSNFRKE